MPPLSLLQRPLDSILICEDQLYNFKSLLPQNVCQSMNECTKFSAYLKQTGTHPIQNQKTLYFETTTSRTGYMVSTQKQDSVTSTNLIVCTHTSKLSVLKMTGCDSQMYKVNLTYISLGIS